MGDKRPLFLLLWIALGCSPTAKNAGPSGELAQGGQGGSPAEAEAPERAPETRGWVWTECGKIPSTVASGLLPEYQPGQAVVGGHPYSLALASSSRITALAMSADGQTLISMGGVILRWQVAPAFSDSLATYLARAQGEWPGLDVSPDGQWISVFGDGRRLLSRDGARGPWLKGTGGDGGCWPAHAQFSPDGTWLVGAGFGPGIDVFRTADLAGSAAGTDIQAFVSLPAPCGPGAIAGQGSTTRVAFTPDGQTLVMETGARYATSDWQVTHETHGPPASHGYNGSLAVSDDGKSVVSDCSYSSISRRYDCVPAGGRFPRFSRDGSWLLVGGTLTHVASQHMQVLDTTAAVGIFAPNGDVIAAADDNTLTHYCLDERLDPLAP